METIKEQDRLSLSVKLKKTMAEIQKHHTCKLNNPLHGIRLDHICSNLVEF